MDLLLRRHRERLGWSVRELARRAGVSYVTVLRVENGQTSPTVAWLEKVAEALGIGMRDLFPVTKAPRPTARRRQRP